MLSTEGKKQRVGGRKRGTQRRLFAGTDPSSLGPGTARRKAPAPLLSQQCLAGVLTLFLGRLVETPQPLRRHFLVTGLE